jgi:hypothetical protein
LRLFKKSVASTHIHISAKYADRYLGEFAFRSGKTLPSRWGVPVITLQELARALGGEIAGDEVLASGPGHSSKDRSLSVKPEPNAPDGLLIHSFANDDPQKCRNYVLTRLGIPRETNSQKSRTGGFHEVAVFPYRGETGTVLFEVVRLEKPSPNGGKPEKEFYQRRANGNGGYVNSVKGVRKVPYRLPHLIETIAGEQTIFIPEGEKCVNSLCEIGLAATCNAGGAGKWPDELTPHFNGADVIILPDNDGPGRDHARLVARKLHGTAKRVRILELPNLHAKGDIADWLANGGTPAPVRGGSINELRPFLNLKADKDFVLAVA